MITMGRTIGTILWGVFFSLGAVISIFSVIFSGKGWSELDSRYLKAVEHSLNGIQETKAKYETSIESDPNREEIEKKYIDLVVDLKLIKDRITSGEDMFDGALVNFIVFLNGVFYLAAGLGLIFHFLWGRIVAICSIWLSFISYIGILIIAYVHVATIISQTDEISSLVALMAHQQNQSAGGMEFLNNHFFLNPIHLVVIISTIISLYYFNRPVIKMHFSKP